MVPLMHEDRILIQILRTEKRFNAHQMMKEFPSRKWNKHALHRLIKQIDATRMSKSRKAHCGRKRSARTLANIERVEELICSQTVIQGRVRVREKLSVQPEFHAVLLGTLQNMT